MNPSKSDLKSTSTIKCGRAEPCMLREYFDIKLFRKGFLKVPGMHQGFNFDSKDTFGITVWTV